MQRELLEIKNSGNPMPALFYPGVRKLGYGVKECLEDGKLQADLLKQMADLYPTAAVVRMTELWCEAKALGVPVTFGNNKFPVAGEPVVEDTEELEELEMPEVVNETTEPLIEAVRLAAPELSKPLIVGVTGPYTLGSVVNGSEDFMMNCMTEPDSVHTFLEHLTGFLKGYAKAYKEAGASGIMLAEPVISMISPEMTKEFSNRYLNEIIEEVQDENFFVLYHNCGAVTHLLDAIAELPVDGFHFGKEVDLTKAFKKIPEEKLIMGNVDPRTFLNGTAEQVEQQTRAVLQTAAGHDNFVLSSGCDLAPEVKEEQLNVFFKVSKER